MLDGFEDYTCELNEEEKELLPVIVNCLKAHDTKDKAITNAKMCEGIKRWRGKNFSGARMRKVIHHIQVNGLLKGLVSCGSAGYYVTSDIKEVVRYVESLKARSRSINDVASAVMNQFGLR